MRLRSLLIAALMLGAASSPAHAAEERVYTGVTILDPLTKRRLPDSYIVVRGDRIAAIGRGRVPRHYARAERLDMTGLFAMPGLFDTHAHVTVGPLVMSRIDGKPGAVMQGDERMTRHDALMLLAYGVTTIRDPGGDTARMVAYRDAVAAGRLIGPAAKVAGGVIDHPPFPAKGLVDSVTEARPVATVVRQQVAAGVDYVKLYEGLSADELKAGIDAAHTAGVTTIAHLSDVSWATAAAMGIDSLVHAMPLSPDLLSGEHKAAYLRTKRPGGWDFYRWYEEVDLDDPKIGNMIATLARRRIPVDATLIVFRQAFWGDDRSLRDADLAYANPSLVRDWTTSFSFDKGWSADDYRRAKAVWPKVLRFVRMLHEAGVPLTIGTDMNNPFVAPGVSVAREAALHVDAGIPAWDVLQMATVNAARLLKVDDRTGRLRPGMEADILFLAADPSIDIHALTSVVGVVENGRSHLPADLMREAPR